MTLQHPQKFSLSATALLALLAFPAVLCAQVVPTANSPKQTPAPAKPRVVKAKPVPHARKLVSSAGAASAPTLPAVQPAVPAQAQPVPPVATAPTSPTVQPTPVAAANKPAANVAQSTAPKTVAARAVNPAATAGSGTLTWGSVVYTPAGCVHNGTKAVCTFTLVNQGNGVTLQAPWQMRPLQFVDDAHVPHFADAAYFVDNYGTRQGQLFVNSGQGGTLIREFPNVNDAVASGEFHLADQVVGGISVGAPGTIPSQEPAVASTPMQPAQPVATNGTTATDPTSQVQNGINQVNDKKQKAKSIRDQMQSIWKKK